MTAPDGAGQADGDQQRAPADNTETSGPEWFLPAGRAGLLPDAITTATGTADGGGGADPSREPGAEEPGAQVLRESGGAVSSTPPWDDAAVRPVNAPPPWETGPWPGPGEVSRDPAGSVAEAAQDQAPLADPSPGEATGASGGLWAPRTVLVAGLVPLCVPGLVAGVLNLHATRPGDPGRRASVLAIAASLAWAVVIIVVLLGVSSGPSAPGCTYPPAVRSAYARVAADLRDHAAPRQLSGDLAVAATRANDAAATGGQLQARGPLQALSGDLAQAQAEAADRGRVTAAVRSQLGADQAAVAAACRG